MVDDLSDREFADMLATIWERYDWKTEVTERNGSLMVAGEHPRIGRGLILVASGDSGPVGEDEIQPLVSFKTERNVDLPVAASRSDFGDGARQLADQNGIHLLDPDKLEADATARGFDDILEEYSGGGILSRLTGAVPIPSIVGRFLSGLPTPERSGGGRRLVGAVLVIGVGYAIVSVLGLDGSVGTLLSFLPIPDLGLLDAIGGVLGGLPLPDFGVGGGYTVTAVSLVDGAGDPVTVEWDARTQSTVRGPNGTEFNETANQTYVIVQLNATNPRSENVTLGLDEFALATAGVRNGPLPLEGATGQLPLEVPANASKRGYIVFLAPENADSGTVLALPGPTATPITFERNRDLAFQVESI